MKLWVWTDVLEDHTSGIAFALGTSPADARRRLIEKYVENECANYTAGSEQYRWLCEEVRQDAVREFSKEPVEMTVGYCYGGG